MLRGGLYAVPALVGAAIVVGAYKADDYTIVFPILGALACFSMRIAGLCHGLGLPRADAVALTSRPRLRRRRGDR